MGARWCWEDPETRHPLWPLPRACPKVAQIMSSMYWKRFSDWITHSHLFSLQHKSIPCSRQQNLQPVWVFVPRQKVLGCLRWRTRTQTSHTGENGGGERSPRSQQDLVENVGLASSSSRSPSRGHYFDYFCGSPNKNKDLFCFVLFFAIGASKYILLCP